MTTTTPRFTHDCTRCKFLGQGHFDKNQVDWYICTPLKRGGKENELRTVIARFGNDGPEYASATIGETVEPSPVVIAALAHGLELNEVEQAKLLKALLAQYRRQLGMAFWSSYAPQIDFNQIGAANWLDLDVETLKE